MARTLRVGLANARNQDKMLPWQWLMAVSECAFEAAGDAVADVVGDGGGVDGCAVGRDGVAAAYNAVSRGGVAALLDAVCGDYRADDNSVGGGDDFLLDWRRRGRSL